MALTGWGADAEDARYEVEVVHGRTGEKRTFVFEAPVGGAAVEMRRRMAALGEDAPMSQVNAVTVQACCAELTTEPVEAVERLIMLTGGSRSALLTGVSRACGGSDFDEEPGWEVQAAVPFSSSARPDSIREA